MQETYPRIRTVAPVADWRLHIVFENGTAKVYDCAPLLDDEAFRHLKNKRLFRSVRADEHGYGVVWNEEIDLAESELWIHGAPAQPSERGDA